MNTLKCLFLNSTLLLLSVILLNAQSEEALKLAFEGSRVELRIEMPASSEGIDIYVDKANNLDFEDYSKRVKQHGISLYPGDNVMVTKIKFKKKHIEFQLAGGGFGTFGDESGHVSSVSIAKSSRQEEIEKKLKENKSLSADDKKKLENERRDLENNRQVRQREADRQAAFEEEMKKSRIQDLKRTSGSRFNIHFEDKIEDKNITPELVRKAISKYVVFEHQKEAPAPQTSAVSSPQSTAPLTLQKGLSIEQVMGLFGIPKNLKTTEECSLEKTTGVFESANQKIEATFIEGILIRYQISSK